MSLVESRDLLLEFMARSGATLETHEIIIEREILGVGWFFMLKTKSAVMLDGGLYQYLINPRRKEVVNAKFVFTVQLYEIWLKKEPPINSLEEFYDFADKFREDISNSRVIYTNCIKSIQTIERKKNNIYIKRNGRILYRIALKKVKIIGRLDIYYPKHRLIDMQVVFIENESNFKLFSSFSKGSEDVLDSLTEYFPGFLPNWLHEKKLENFSMALWWSNLSNEDYGKTFELFEKIALPQEEDVSSDFSKIMLEPKLDFVLSEEALSRL